MAHRASRSQECGPWPKKTLETPALSLSFYANQIFKMCIALHLNLLGRPTLTPMKYNLYKISNEKTLTFKYNNILSGYFQPAILLFVTVDPT